MLRVPCLVIQFLMRFFVTHHICHRCKCHRSWKLYFSLHIHDMIRSIFYTFSFNWILKSIFCRLNSIFGLKKVVGCIIITDESFKSIKLASTYCLYIIYMCQGLCSYILNGLCHEIDNMEIFCAFIIQN